VKRRWLYDRGRKRSNGKFADIAALQCQTKPWFSCIFLSDLDNVKELVLLMIVRLQMRLQMSSVQFLHEKASKPVLYVSVAIVSAISVAGWA